MASISAFSTLGVLVSVGIVPFVHFTKTSVDPVSGPSVILPFQAIRHVFFSSIDPPGCS